MNMTLAQLKTRSDIPSTTCNKHFHIFLKIQTKPSGLQLILPTKRSQKLETMNKTVGKKPDIVQHRLTAHTRFLLVCFQTCRLQGLIYFECKQLQYNFFYKCFHAIFLSCFHHKKRKSKEGEAYYIFIEVSREQKR